MAIPGDCRSSAADSQRDRPLARRRAFGRKLLFAAVTVTTFFALLEGLLALCGVRPLADREDPYVGFAGYSPLFVERASADGTVQFITADQKLTWFNRQQFPKTKPPDTVRIFCLGGSTTYGHPYADETSFCGWLREFLPVADPGRKWEVINAGGISYASYRVARLMEELDRYEPDLFIIYTGQNEFLERRTYGRMLETPEPVRGLAGLLARTRTLSAMKLVIDSIPRGQKPEPVASESFTLPAEVRTRLDSSVGLEAYSRDDALTQQVTAHFRQNLQRIARLARSTGAEVIFVTPASNLADCAPFKSEHRGGISAADAQRCDNLFEAARAELTEGDRTVASSLVEQALSIDDQFADAHYLHGRCCLAFQKYDDARAAFVRARDEDVCPLRAISPLRTAMLDAARDEGVPVVDFARLIDELSPHEIPGREWFLDHVHPTVDGHRRLALALLNEMTRAGTLRPSKEWNDAAMAAVTKRVTDGIDAAYQALALRNLSKTLGWAGKLDEADRLALEAVQLNPQDAEAQYQAGNALYRRGDLAGALNHFEQSQRLSPSQPQIYYGLGLIHQELDEPDDAISCYREAIRRDPDFADAYFNLALLLEHHGALEEAAANYRVVVRLYPEDASALNNLGVVEARLGRTAEAAQLFQRALRLRPAYADACANLARVHLQAGDRPAAASAARAALRLEPGHPTATWVLKQTATPGATD